MLREASHEPLGAGTITLIAENGSQVACGWTDATGKYRLEAPASGTYLVVVTAPGRHPVAARVAVAADRDSTRDFTLEKLTQGSAPATSAERAPVAGRMATDA